MLRFLARRWAKIQYTFHAETEAANNDLNARLVLNTAADKRHLVSMLTSQADEMDARIKAVTTRRQTGHSSVATLAEVHPEGRAVHSERCDEARCEIPHLASRKKVLSEVNGPIRWPGRMSHSHRAGIEDHRDPDCSRHSLRASVTAQKA